MSNRSSSTKLASFDRRLTLMTADVWFMWFLLVIAQLALQRNIHGGFGNAVFTPFVSFIVLPLLFALGLEFIQKWRSRHKFRSLTLLNDRTILWTTVARGKKIPLTDILAFKLYTTNLSPPGTKHPSATYSGSLHHRSGVIFVDGLSRDEFQQLRQVFESIRLLRPEALLVEENLPYSLDMEIFSHGA